MLRHAHMVASCVQVYPDPELKHPSVSHCHDGGTAEFAQEASVVRSAAASTSWGADSAPSTNWEASMMLSVHERIAEMTASSLDVSARGVEEPLLATNA